MNKLSTLFLSTLAFGIILTGCNKDSSHLGASKNSQYRLMDEPAIDVVVEEMPIAGFNEVVNEANFPVVVIPDTAYNVIVVADDYQTLAEVNPVVNQGVLEIQAPANITTEATVYVRTPVVGSLKINKNGRVVAQGNYSTLDITLKGNGDGIITGTANQLRVSGGGNGKLDALGMPAIDVVVNMKGNAQVKVAPQNTLDVDLGGNSKVFYTGNPTVTKKLKGNASIKKI